MCRPGAGAGPRSTGSARRSSRAGPSPPGPIAWRFPGSSRSRRGWSRPAIRRRFTEQCPGRGCGCCGRPRPAPLSRHTSSHITGSSNAPATAFTSWKTAASRPTALHSSRSQCRGLVPPPGDHRVRTPEHLTAPYPPAGHAARHHSVAAALPLPPAGRAGPGTRAAGRRLRPYPTAHAWRTTGPVAPRIGPPGPPVRFVAPHTDDGRMPPDRPPSPPPTTALAVFRPRHLRQSLGCFVSALFGERLLLRQDGSAHAGISGASAPAERRRPRRSRQLSSAVTTTRGQSSPMRAGCRRPELNRLSPGRRSGLHGSGTDRGTAPRRQPRVRPKRPASTLGRRRGRSSPARSPRRSRIRSSSRLKASPRTGVSNKRPCLTFGGDGESWAVVVVGVRDVNELVRMVFSGLFPLVVEDVVDEGQPGVRVAAAPPSHVLGFQAGPGPASQPGVRATHRLVGRLLGR